MDTFLTPEQGPSFRVSLLIISGILFCLLVGGALWLSYLLFQPVMLQRDYPFVVSQGESIRSIAARLKQEGIIRSALMFRILASFGFTGKTLKAGEYLMTGSPMLADTVMVFVRGAPTNEYTVTIIEGWTLADIANALEAKGVVASQLFLQATQDDYTARAPFLPPRSRTTSLEGYLFPDTYRFFKNSTARDVIEKMLENFSDKYSADMVAATIQQKRDVHAIVTLASILEREIPDERDRRMVADIFYRRLAKEMPLQADSTINYITGRKDTSVRTADLEITSAYNTYRNKGLPPGPIGNPGLVALQAALSPIENPFWFFLTTPNGEVIYSKTFEEHVKNKLKYLSK